MAYLRRLCAAAYLGPKPVQQRGGVLRLTCWVGQRVVSAGNRVRFERPSVPEGVDKTLNRLGRKDLILPGRDDKCSSFERLAGLKGAIAAWRVVDASILVEHPSAQGVLWRIPLRIWIEGRNAQGQGADGSKCNGDGGQVTAVAGADDDDGVPIHTWPAGQCVVSSQDVGQVVRAGNGVVLDAVTSMASEVECHAGASEFGNLLGQVLIVLVIAVPTVNEKHTGALGSVTCIAGNQTCGPALATAGDEQIVTFFLHRFTGVPGSSPSSGLTSCGFSW